MKSIASRDNPNFKALKALAHDARLQRQTQQTLLDGPHLLTAALDHGVSPDLVVISETAAGQPEVTALLARVAGIAGVTSVNALCLRDALFNEISELKTPLGILARIAVPPAPTFPIDGDCLLLDAVQDAGNVGTLLRTAAAAGVKDVLLGPGCAGAWTPRVLRAAQGAHFGLRLREQVDLASFLSAYPGQSVATVVSAATMLYALDCRLPTAWLFGNEGQGVSAALIAATRQRVTIPLAVGNESLNVAAAAAICLFEMRRQRNFG